jgi:hypothetical protein
MPQDAIRGYLHSEMLIRGTRQPSLRDSVLMYELKPCRSFPKAVLWGHTPAAEMK